MRARREARIGVSGAVVALIATAAAGGSARAQSSIDNRLLGAQPGTTLRIRIGGDVQDAEVSRDRIASRTVDLNRQGVRVWGTVGDAQVDLVLEPRHVRGDVEGRPVSLDVLPRQPRALSVAGKFGNRDVALDINPARVTGAVGPCLYRTDRRGDAYVGQVSCGGAPEPVELRFPAALVARSDVELATILTAILAR